MGHHHWRCVCVCVCVSLNMSAWLLVRVVSQDYDARLNFTSSQAPASSPVSKYSAQCLTVLYVGEPMHER